MERETTGLATVLEAGLTLTALLPSRMVSRQAERWKAGHSLRRAGGTQA